MLKAKRTAVGGSVFAVALLLGTLAYGQTTGGTILGAVSDDSGARVPGVAVTIRNVETGIVRSVTTDSGGRYRAPNLGVGLYEVKAELMGFRTAVRMGIQLTVAAETTVNLTLSVGAVTEQVEVTGEAPLIETTSAALSGLVDDKKIRDLPLNGRSFEQLAFLTPGVTPFYRSNRATDQGEGTKFSVSGSRVDSNNFLMDGTSITDQSNTTPGSASGQFLGVETLREFRVLTGTYGAEYGRYSGGIITATTKSGTNALDGNLFAFHRNDNLDARNFFDRQSAPDDPRLPEFKRNQFGGTIGGPIRRDQTHFFGGYEGLRERKGLSNVAFVPDADAHRGIIPLAANTCRSDGGVVLPDGRCQLTINPTAQPFLDLYPLPNGGNFGDGSAELFSNPNQPIREDMMMARFDHRFSDSDSMFVRYNLDDSKLASPTLYPTITNDSATRSQYSTVQETRIFSPRVINSARAGLNRFYSNQTNHPLFEVKPEHFFVPGSQLGLITFRGIGITEYGGDAGYPRRFGHNVWQFVDDLTASLGSHTLKMGMLYERTQSNSTLSRNFGGQYYFNGFNDFLLGRAEEFQGDVPGTDTVRGWRQRLFGFYLQDDFQVRSNLTLNLGLRYEFTTVPTEVNGKIANFRYPLTDALPTCLKAGRRSTTGDCNFTADSWFEGSYKDFGPRVGLSWDPFSNGKTAIRAGFGMYFDHLVTQPLNRALSRVPPFTATAQLTGATATSFPRLDLGQLKGDPRALVNYSMQNKMFDPTKIAYTFSIQQELTPQMGVTAAYAGSHSYHQLVGNNGNDARPEILPDGRKFYPCRIALQPGQACPTAQFPLRRNPNIGQLQFFITPEGSATYHSLQLSFNRRFSGGLQLQGSYTYSKYISDVDAVFYRGLDAGTSVPQDPDNVGAERGLAVPDIRNYFAFNYTYDLPFARNLTGVAGKVFSGWQLNGIVALANGTPFTVMTGFNRSRDRSSGLNIGDRPNLLPDFVGKNLTEGSSAGCAGIAPGPVGTPDRYFDICAFGLPEAGFYGNLGRNTIIGPGLVNFDFALMKNTSLTETTSLQFRAEFFNLFNRANFNRPGAKLASIRAFSASGARVNPVTAITSTITEARQIQLGLKLTF